MSISRRAGACGIFILAFLLNSGLHAEEWKTYVSGRFGYSVQYPASFKLRKEAENGSSMQFWSPDREFTVYISGHFLNEFLSLESSWKEALEAYGSEILHKEKKSDSYVISGVTKKGTAFYYRFCTKGSNWADLDISYPAADHQKYARWVKRITASFIPFLPGDYDRVEE